VKLSQNNETPEVEVPEGPKPKKERKPLSKTILFGAIGVILGLVLASGLAFYIHKSQIDDELQSQLQGLAKQKAKLGAQNIQKYFENNLVKAEYLAANSLLRIALQENDTDFLQKHDAQIKKQMEEVVSVRFIQEDDISLNDDIYPPIRFSELEMLRASMEGKQGLPEAVRIEKTWLLHYVKPIPAEDPTQTTGLLWVSTETKNLRTQLKKGLENLGRLTLIQKFSERAQTAVTATGSADREIRALAQIENSPWQVEFQVHSNLIAETHINTALVYAVLVAVFLACIGTCSGAGFAIGRKLEANARRARLAQGRGLSGASASGDAYVDPMYQSKDMLNVNIKKEDESLLGMEDEDDESSAASAANLAADEGLELDDDVFDMIASADSDAYPAEVFRAYDIRGLAGEQLNKVFAEALGKAIGCELQDMRCSSVVVARDARTHSPELAEWLVRGILSTGCNVINIGTVPTPMMYFAIETLDEINSGVMVTASHNAAPYNGFKIVLNGVTRSGDDIQALRQRMIKADFYQGQGQEHRHDIVPAYIDTIFSDVALAGELSVVVDAGNAVAGLVAPKLFEELGCRVIPLYCDVDGNFPNHDPDPSRQENLQDLIAKVQDQNADIGIALDGDGDRLTVVTPKGEIIWADRLLMAFTKDIVSRNPGADVVFDVKCTRHLNTCITNCGGRPIMWKTGHALMKQKMVDSGALVGGEYSGHIFIKDRWFGFDDGMYAAARLLEIISLQGEDADTVFAEFPTSLITPEIRVTVGEDRKFEIIAQLKQQGDFGDGRLTQLDGIRADFANGWGLVRASNTGPDITLRFEADDESAMHELKAKFVQELRKVDSSINVDWNQN
jgi:phosphomannomutase/phosphoglucomutase